MSGKESDWFWLASHNDWPMWWHLDSLSCYVVQFFIFMVGDGRELTLNVGYGEQW